MQWRQCDVCRSNALYMQIKKTEYILNGKKCYFLHINCRQNSPPSSGCRRPIFSNTSFIPRICASINHSFHGDNQKSHPLPMDIASSRLGGLVPLATIRHVNFRLGVGNLSCVPFSVFLVFGISTTEDDQSNASMCLLKHDDDCKNRCTCCGGWNCIIVDISRIEDDSEHGPLTRYANLWVARNPGMPGTFSPSPISKETAS